MHALTHGCMHSLDWTTGLEYWTGLLERFTHAHYVRICQVMQHMVECLSIKLAASAPNYGVLYIYWKLCAVRCMYMYIKHA